MHGSTNHVEAANSFKLMYHVRYTSIDDVTSANAWLDAALEQVLAFEAQQVRVVALTSLSLEQEFERSVHEVIGLFLITFAVISVFAVLSVFAIDMVRSKPLVAAGTT